MHPPEKEMPLSLPDLLKSRSLRKTKSGGPLSHMVLLLPPLNMTAPFNNHCHSQAWLTTSAIQLCLDNILTLSPQQTPVTSVCLALAPPSYNPSLLSKLSPWQIKTFQQNRPTICQPDNISLPGQPTSSPWLIQLIYKAFSLQTPPRPHSTEWAYQPRQSDNTLSPGQPTTVNSTYLLTRHFFRSRHCSPVQQTCLPITPIW